MRTSQNILTYSSRRNIFRLWFVSWGVVASSPVFGNYCAHLLAYIGGNSPALRITQPTPDQSRVQANIFEIKRKVEKVCLEKANALGEEVNPNSDVIKEAKFVAGELFKNAAMWGNKFNKEKFITVEVHADEHGITISVQDEGEKAFDPFSDPGSFRNEETTKEFEKRRKQLHKTTDDNISAGLFWTIQKDNDAHYAYHFDEGSIVVVRVPWTFNYAHIEEPK